MKSNHNRYILLLTGIIAFICSCTPEGCLENTESYLEASFYSYLPPRNAKVPDSLTVYGLGRDSSKVYMAAQGVKAASLPLNPASSSSAFIIRINGTADTLVLKYNSYPHLISKECGYTWYHDIYPDSITFTRNTIDSIWVKNRVITTVDEDNIHIFF